METKEIKKNTHGGARKGSGGKGRKLPKTLLKEASLERIKDRVYKMSDKLISAQAISAMGTHKMITKDKSGKITTVVNVKRMQMLIDTGELGVNYFIMLIMFLLKYFLLFFDSEHNLVPVTWIIDLVIDSLNNEAVALNNH